MAEWYFLQDTSGCVSSLEGVECAQLAWKGIIDADVCSLSLLLSSIINMINSTISCNDFFIQTVLSTLP